MNNRKYYITNILGLLLKKYYKREIRYGQIKTARRIVLNIGEVYSEYEKSDADITIKRTINQVIRELEELKYINSKYLPYSDDVEKLYLRADNVKKIETYLEEEFGILARPSTLENMNRLVEEYAHRGTLTEYYCDRLMFEMEHRTSEPDVEKERELLEMLAFIQDNKRELYTREVSVLVYGNSKHFEKERYETVCSIIREALGKPVAEREQNGEILQFYHISNTDQEISLKGDFLIEIEGYYLETKYFAGGLSLSTRDIARIRRIVVRTSNIITIENKTSFYRFEKEDYSAIYLGGYASRQQIELIRGIYAQNSDCEFWHFGDIDVGGFLIHQHLCNATGICFRLFCMGKEELDNEKYKCALLKLTGNDIVRAEKLAENSIYRDVLAEMMKRSVKLEQEIVSLDL